MIGREQKSLFFPYTVIETDEKTVVAIFGLLQLPKKPTLFQNQQFICLFWQHFASFREFNESNETFSLLKPYCACSVSDFWLGDVDRS